MDLHDLMMYILAINIVIGAVAALAIPMPLYSDGAPSDTSTYEFSEDIGADEETTLTAGYGLSLTKGSSLITKLEIALMGLPALLRVAFGGVSAVNYTLIGIEVMIGLGYLILFLEFLRGLRLFG